MPRSGGLFAGAGRQLVEAAAKRTLGVDLAEDTDLRGKLVEALTDLRNERRLSRRLAWQALNAIGRWARGQDDTAENRLGVTERVRSIARVDSHMMYAIRLRVAFCVGDGAIDPKANDDDVQEVVDDFWTALPNIAELTGKDAQWRNARDLFTVCNLYHLVFDDGLDGRVLLAGLQHDQVRDVVRDPRVWRRILYYQVHEYVYEFDYGTDTVKSHPKHRVVYYEAFDGFRELDEEMAEGRPAPQCVADMPADRIRPGRVLHVAINRGREQAFGEPEMRTTIQWAASFADLLAGQVEKSRSAQKFLMKVTATGAATEEQLRNTALTALERRSPLGSSLEMLGDDVGQQERAGAALWGNEAIKAEPFDLKAGSAREDLESASQAFASGTNFPGHYFFGDPGSLAGSMAVELPVLKLTDIDQAVVLGVMRKMLDHRIQRAIKVGLLSERREPTDDELAAGIELGDDGMVERDLSYQLALPEATRRNLPELMQLVADTAATFDPQGGSEPLTRALLGYVLGELLEFPDTPALVERIFAEANAAQDLGGGQPGHEGTGDPTSTGPDGKQHRSDNPYGARRQSASVEAAMGSLWQRLVDPDDPLAVELAEIQADVAAGERDPLVEAHNIPNAFGRGPRFGLAGRFRGKFHPGRGGADVVPNPKRMVHRLRDGVAKAVKAGANKAFPNAEPRYDDGALDRYEQEQVAYALADPGPEAGADEAWLKSVRADARRANRALDVALGPDLAKYIDQKWGRDAGVRQRLLDGEITVEEADEIANEHYQEVEARRFLREQDRTLDYGLNRKAMPCFSCGRFKRRPSDVCEHCGDDPVQYGTSRHQFDRDYGYSGREAQADYGVETEESQRRAGIR